LYKPWLERLGPIHPQTFSVAAESFSSSVVCKQTIGYSNQDLDYRLLHRVSQRSFDAVGTTFYLVLANHSSVGWGLKRDPFSERTDSAGEL
jgi:hypothetical protein